MNTANAQTISLKFNESKIEIIDQTLLPFTEQWIDITDPKDAVLAIKNLKVRGAPLIGVVASLCFGIFCRKENNKQQRLFWWEQLITSRPTAVNLVHFMNEIKPLVDSETSGELIFKKAYSFFKSDQSMCDKMASIGAEVLIQKLGLVELPNKQFSLLTHCNTGGLATAGQGTALSVIKNMGLKFSQMMTYVDETRPLLQGARLTTWELGHTKQKYKLICDNMAGFLMMQKKVDAVLVGADRITSTGDSANKIGTYSLAVLCHYHKIPFYIVAPTTTIDSLLKFGSEIPIEERSPNEVRGFASSKESLQWALEEVEVYNPSFDWVPSSLITGWITEDGYYEKEDLAQGSFAKYQKAGVI
jgi:methylthioribose-1-phosphate isomerase